MAAKADEKNLQIVFATGPEIPALLIGDQLRLRQILSNLVSNAIKFTEKGTVQIAVALDEDSRTDRMALTFSITDTGIGMNSEHLLRIFAPFTQADSSITRRYGGTGLGLSIVSRLLELMGSKLEVVSTPGQGSMFSFTVEFGLPVGREQVPPSGSQMQLCDVHILLVEDDKINQIVAQEILKHFGAEVVTIDNGASAVEAVLSNDFDMVFMDIQMPGMNGYEAAAAIRQTKGVLELPIIAMTAHALKEERDRCLAAGMNDHVPKPIDPDQLYSVLLKWLSPEKVRSTPVLKHKPDGGTSSRMLPDSLPGIDIASVLRRCGGNETLAREIIICFRDQNRNVFNELCHAVKNGNRDHANALLHSIKGLAGTVGAVSLAATASGMESALESECKNVDLKPPVIMEQQLAEVFEAAEILEGMQLDHTSDPKWVQLPQEKLEPLLKELYDSLHNNSLGAKKLYDQLQKHLRQPERDEIHTQMIRLDFERAREALERAAQSQGISLQRRP